MICFTKYAVVFLGVDPHPCPLHFVQWDGEKIKSSPLHSPLRGEGVLEDQVLDGAFGFFIL